MDRKDFFKTIARKRVSSFSRSNNFFFAGLNPYTGNWTMNEVTHLLKRTMFGAKKPDIDYFQAKTMDQAVDELLTNITVSSPPVRDYGLIEDDMGMMHDDVGVAQGQTWVNDLNNTSDEMVRNSIDSSRIDSLRKWWTGLIV